jgi:dipeptidyl aminopeptidase/acylaminoacyl peptidase
VLLAIAVVTATAFTATAAQAAYPGENGKIAFERSGAIWTINPGGSQETQITNGTSQMNDRAPAWSPDGTKVAFERRRQTCAPNVCYDLHRERRRLGRNPRDQRSHLSDVVPDRRADGIPGTAPWRARADLEGQCRRHGRHRRI